MSWPNLTRKYSTCDQSRTLAVFAKQRQRIIEEFVTVSPNPYGCVDILVSSTAARSWFDFV